MTRAVGPKVGFPSEATLPLALIGVMWVPALAATLVWLGGHVASWITGHGFTGPDLSVDWALRFPAHGPGGSWPDVAPAAVWAATAVLAAAVILPIAVAAAKWQSRPGAGDPLASLARPRDVSALCPAGVASKARQLRPSLSNAKTVRSADAGVPLGRLRPAGPDLAACWEDVMVVLMAPRSGKALAADTPVLTPHGWAPIDQLIPGDAVIGSDGQPTKVVGVYPQGVRTAYQVEFSDGAGVVCDAGHLWTVRKKVRRDRGPEPRSSWHTLTLRELLDAGLLTARGTRRFHIPLVHPVAFEGIKPPGEPSDLPLRGKRQRTTYHLVENVAPPLHPYVLGALLGDGGLTTRTVVFTTCDQDLFDRLSGLLPEQTRLRSRTGSGPYEATLVSTRKWKHNPITKALRELGLMGHGAHSKFVPDPYKFADTNCRLELLRGLLDTDGTVNALGNITFDTSSPRLAEDVTFLVRSLGGTSRRSTRPTGALVSHRLAIWLPRSIEPFTLPRKAERVARRLNNTVMREPTRTIVSAEPVGTTEMVCIAVDAPDGLFVVKDFVVTHNTSALAVPQVLDAPGAVVATSNKVDLWALTHTARTRRGRCWVFDPQRIALVPQTWWWNPLAGVTTVEAAQRLTTHFIAEIRGDREREFWSSAAEDVLASLFLAAGSAGRTLADVYDWLNRPTNPTPVDLLRHYGHVASASGLAGRQAGATETREGVFETARTAAKCLRDPNIMAWVTPPPFDLTEFDTAGFAAGGDTLYLLTKDSAGGAAPLVAAFADRVMADATTLAERRGGRLDPPLLVVLDEAANICKIADLPKLYSHLGSRGIVPVTILQSYPQGVGVWGETGMDTLWAASTVKLVGAGLDDDRFLEKVSRLVGEHDVAVRSVHHGGGSHGENLSVRRQRILGVEDLRQLTKATAVLFATGCRPAMVALRPWYEGPQAAEISAAYDETLAALTRRANTTTTADDEEAA